MIALAGNFHFFRARVLADRATVFVTGLHKTPARQVRALVLRVGCHHRDCSPFFQGLSLLFPPDDPRRIAPTEMLTLAHNWGKGGPKCYLIIRLIC